VRLFQRREREVKRHAAGGVKLQEAIPPVARGQIGHALSDHVLPDAKDLYGYGWTDWNVLNDQVKWVLTRAWGVANLADEDVRNILHRATDGEVLDVIEAWFPAIRRVAAAVESASGVIYTGGSPTIRLVTNIGEQYRSTINDIFDERSVGWFLTGERVVPRSSEAMHSQIVEPVLALTNGQPKFAEVELSYQTALRELKPGGDPSDAITDAGRALQQMLVAVGAKGNALGPLLADARKRELIGAYDSKLAEGFDSIGAWVSADRSVRGDAHQIGNASREDAWLAVRVVGALILRLASGRR
jgi:hypothetical protein